jgi:hypothetical protein
MQNSIKLAKNIAKQKTVLNEMKPVTGWTTPRSVMMEWMRVAGVTSKAGLKASTPLGAACEMWSEVFVNKKKGGCEGMGGCALPEHSSAESLPCFDAAR